MNATIGSVSSGTMRTPDLIESFMSELSGLDRPRYETLVNELHCLGGQNGDADGFVFIESLCERLPDDASEWLSETLFSVLDEYSPDFCSFGAHRDDGSDYGFWVDMDSVVQAGSDGEIRTVDELPDAHLSDYDYIMVVSDHGNCTLFYWDHEIARYKEIWAIV